MGRGKLYRDEERDEMIAAQERFLDGVGFEREIVQREIVQ